MRLPGIGKGIAGAIKEYMETGRMRKYEDLKKRYPIDFNGITKVPGIGAKKAFRLYRTLKVRNVEDLKKAIGTHSVSKIPGFGERSENEISKGILQLESGKGRMSIGTALPEAEALIKRLKESGLVKRVAIGGSTRRMRETVGDLDILVTSSHADKVMKFISKLDEVQDITLGGHTKTTVWLKIGISCDIRVVKDKSFGAALQYFTGNKDHNVKVRQIAIRKGYKLNEYGMFDKKGRNVSGPDEESIYSKLGMDIMDPEMREDLGEVELSIRHKLPRIVQAEDIKGDLHVHTNHSDGSDSIMKMAEYAKSLGRQYIGITDHTKSEYVAHGMNDAQFIKHFNDIDKVGEAVKGIKILKSAEIDILKDGSLDLKDSTLEMMDYRLASIHTSLSMSKSDMTNRVITAIGDGYVDILAHPTDRIINTRNPIDMDLDKVFQAAHDNNVALEIDGYPDRMDLNDENIRKAMEHDVKFSISTDSHSAIHLNLMRYGISTAKRGWVTPGIVINTFEEKTLLKEFNE